MFDILEADIVIMQEAKIQRKDLTDDMVLVNGWDVFFSLPRDKKGKSFLAARVCLQLTSVTGYSGVAIYTRNSKCCPIRAEEGVTGVLCPPKSSTKFRDLPADQQIGGYPRDDQLLGPIDEVVLDSEGRTVILEFPAFVLIGVYVPATRDDSRTDFRMGFLSALDARIRNLVAMGKQVILAGDLNIIRSDIDTAHCVEQLKKEDMTLDEFMSMPSRRLFNQLVFEGQVIGERDEGREEPVMWDLTRTFHPDRKGMHTCWETKKNARPGNFGSRIDYILCTPGIKPWFEDSNIQEGLMGSDHCPVYATIADHVRHDGQDRNIDDLMNPDDMFKDGQRLREWNSKDLLPQSAKLLTEFDRRRSIKDMFTKKPRLKQASTDTTTADTSNNAEAPFSTQTSPTPAVPVSSTISSAADTSPAEYNDFILTAPQKVSSKQIAIDSSSTELKSPDTSASLTAPVKRAASAASTPPSKKTKTAPAKGKGKPGPAQSSLRGFFKPKTSGPDAMLEEKQNVAGSSALMAMQSPPAPTTPSPAKRAATFSSQLDAAGDVPEDSGLNSALAAGRESEPVADGERVFDPIESKESWSKLLGKKRAAPLCEHEEPCISLITKKAGVNTGKCPQYHQVS